MNAANVIGLVCLVGATVTTVGAGALLVLPPHHDVLRDPVSHFRTTRPALFGLVAGGEAVGGATGALVLNHDDALGLGLFLTLAVAVLTRVLVVLVPPDPPAAPRTERGRAHHLLTAVGHLAFAVAAWLAGTALRDQGLGLPATLSTWTAATMGVCLLVTGVVLVARRRFVGLPERLFHLALVVWLVTLSALGLAATS